MSKALLTLVLLAASASASAIGVAGVAARGGNHRYCDDACRYRLDQEADRRAERMRERELAREAEQARQLQYKLRPYTPPPPKPPGPHAEAMGRVNILRGSP